ncbi:Lrp/AsnC family transcriptional regulator [Streptomyces sp. NPDC020379]|uniref:Lrp/AsnC family transcriptional regulator n=1 Tax=Streptomyces sp. NPDC020379 TaxID=3365071 RepID=UPI0037A05F0D
MGSPAEATPGEQHEQLVRELQADGRAPFSRIAQSLGVSEQTVARRYRHLYGMGLRVVGQPVPDRLGRLSWLLRLHCTPDAAAKIADALARRPDTSWITLASGGTELYCGVTTRTHEERDALLLHRLPRTPSLVSVQAYCLLRAFTDTPATSRYPQEPLDRPGLPADDELVALDTTDELLLAELAEDGRRPLPELALAVGRSPSGVKRRLERLRSTGALEFVVDFPPQHFGYYMPVRLWLRVTPGELSTIGTTLAGHPEIIFVAAITGPSNLVATGLFRGNHDLYAYLNDRIGALPGVQSVETAPILREVKRLLYGPLRP